MSELISRKRIDEDLTLHIYKKKCFYDRLWTPETIEARGAITDRDGNFVSRPFAKIFNYMENGHRPFTRDTEVICAEKVNGYLLVVSLWKGELLYSTKGGWDSESVKWGRQWLEPHADAVKTFLTKSLLPVTLMYEICDSERDPHIVVEKDGCYLIGIRNNVTGKLWSPLDLPSGLSDFVPNAEIRRFGDVVRDRKTAKGEGWVCYSRNLDDVCKVKTAEYLTAKFFARLGPAKVKLLFENPRAFEQSVDEEFYPIAEAIRSTFSHTSWTLYPEQEKLEWLRSNLK